MPPDGIEAIRIRVAVEALVGMESEEFSGQLFRATLADADPFEGSAGGRWSAGPDAPVLYSSLSAASAVAELADRLRDQDDLSASRKYVLHEWEMSSVRVVRLTSPSRQGRLGLPVGFLEGDDYRPTQRIAQAALRIGTLQGLLVPGSVDGGLNLVLFRDRLEPGQIKEVGASRVRPVDLGAESHAESAGGGA